MQVNKLDLEYGNKAALKNINLDIYNKNITALIGPSGCGKSSFLRCLNRMNDLIDKARISGEILLDDKNIYSKKTDEVLIRRKVGMVFQRPNPFPKTIYENIAYAPRVHNIVNSKKKEQALVEDSLKKAHLWDEVKDSLHEMGTALSGGQQQRLCIARTIAVKPEVILMDEPTSALDPISTSKIEELMIELKKDFTIVIVTHNIQQARRISDRMAFFYMGKLVESGKTDTLFDHPEQKDTADYLSGRYG